MCSWGTSHTNLKKLIYGITKEPCRKFLNSKIAFSERPVALI